MLLLDVSMGMPTTIFASVAIPNLHIQTPVYTIGFPNQVFAMTRVVEDSPVNPSKPRLKF